LGVRHPDHILSHGFVIAADGRKMSKSFNNVIDPNYLLDTFGSDIVRYYFLKESSNGEDFSLSEAKISELYNSDLANIYGNLVSRYIGMTKKYSNNVIAKASDAITEKDEILINKIKSTHNEIANHINEFKINKAIISVYELSECANKYIEETKPWELAKNNKTDEINNFLFYLGNSIRSIISYLTPVLTKGIIELKKQLNFTDKLLDYKSLLNFNLLDKHTLNDAKIIYARK
jgi:methionyl-tRNA synthetase